MADFVSAAGKSYILRADLNVLGSLQARYGSVSAAVSQADGLAELLKIAAEMINEHFYAAGSPERLTPAALGAELSGKDIAPLTAAVAEAVSESLGIGNLKKKEAGKAGEETDVIPVGKIRNLAAKIGGYDRRQIGLMPLWLLYDEISDAYPRKSNDEEDDYEDVI